VDNKVVAYFSDGSKAEADFLVGADGSKSLVRKQRTDALVLEKVNVTSVAGFLPAVSPSVLPKLSELVRRQAVRIITNSGDSVLVMKFKSNSMEDYFVWGISHPSTPEEPTNFVEDCIERARSVNAEVQKLVELTPVENFLKPRELYSAKKLNNNPFKMVNRITLLGDAAHSMTTHRGLGANCALLDGLDLAKCLQEINWRNSVATYQSTMLKRGFDAVGGSLQSTNTLHATGWKASVRDGLVWVIGNVISLKKTLVG